MKITESQLKTIILEEAAKVKQAISLKKQLQEVQQQLDEVMGGPHGGGKKTFKKPEGGDFSKENAGAIVEDDMDMDIEETQLPGDEFGMEESFDFSEQELEEMLNMAEGDGLDEYGDEHHISTEDAVAQSSAQAPNLTPQHSGEGEGEDIMAEADKTSDPFTVDAPKQFNLKESTEALRMKKLAGLL